jgi:hypothetical protein
MIAVVKRFINRERIVRTGCKLMSRMHARSSASWRTAVSKINPDPLDRIQIVSCQSGSSPSSPGVLALENSFNQVDLDHVVLVKVASTAVVARTLGLSRDEIINAVSLAWVDSQSLRTYRHTPNTGSRKSWAAGDAASRAVRLASDPSDARRFGTTPIGSSANVSYHARPGRP